MPDNYNQATISPQLPASLFREVELQSLETACGLQHARMGELLYFYAEEFQEIGEDERGNVIDCAEFLQDKLKQIDAAIVPFITIEGAAYCSRMMADQFGGFACFITRQKIRHLSTSQWLLDQKLKSK